MTKLISLGRVSRETKNVSLYPQGLPFDNEHNSAGVACGINPAFQGQQPDNTCK